MSSSGSDSKKRRLDESTDAHGNNAPNATVVTVVNQKDATTTAENAETTAPPPPQPHHAAATTTNKTTIFVGGLHPRIAQAHLEKLLQPYGDIQRLHYVVHKGFCFCEYSAEEQARAAQVALDGKRLLGKILSVKPAKHDQHSASSTIGHHAKPRATKSLESRIQALKQKLKEKQAT